ncbi:MAG: hypothetical protein V4773_08310 [Verrucomicrobiota bacterium]
MVVNFPVLIIGLLLLWFPRQWLRLGKVIGHRKKHRTGGDEPWKTREPGDPRLSFREFGKMRNYVDLLRGAVGSVAILGGSTIEAGLHVGPLSDRTDARIVLVIQLAILLIGVLIQMTRYERKHLSFYAPVFYIAGLSLALCGPWGALFAFTMVWAFSPLFGNGEVFLLIYAIMLVVFGKFLHETTVALPIAAGVFCFLPALLSLLMRKPLVVFTRKASSGAGG